MILMDQSSGNPLDLVINLVMVDKNNQIYELSEMIFPELPLLMIPKMEKITSFVSEKYLLSFKDYKAKPYKERINTLENMRIYDSKNIFTSYVPTLNNYKNKLLFDLYVKTKNCQPGEVRKSRSECQVCQIGKYSHNVRERACRICPSNAVCPGRNMV